MKKSSELTVPVATGAATTALVYHSTSDQAGAALILGHGAGAESRRPLGVVVVGGLLFSQIITLYITPVVYTYLDAWQKRLARRGAKAPRDYAEPRGEARAAEAAG